jgi:solute carrier family 25 oxoglutarate transporter 11
MPEMTPFVSFATASLGGISGWIVVHPMNSIAIRTSLASTSGAPFSVAEAIKKEGPLTFYRGLGAGCWRQLIYAGSRFGLYEEFRDRLHEVRGKTDFTSRLVCGTAGGGIAAYLSCPMEVCVVRMSNDMSLPAEERRNYKGVGDAFKRIIKEEGVPAFWRGSTPFVQRAMMVGAFQVATYDEFKGFFADKLNQKKGALDNTFCAAMASGLIYSLATMPLEAAKNRMAGQKPNADGSMRYTGTVQTLTKVAKEEGAMALYKGYLPYYLRCGGHTVSMFIMVQMYRDAYVNFGK